MSVPAALALGNVFLAIAALACLMGYAAYLVAALTLVHAPWRIYASLAMAPVYIAWKVGLYARSMLGSRSTVWVRTART